jgi:hypothetical protein
LVFTVLKFADIAIAIIQSQCTVTIDRGSLASRKYQQYTATSNEAETMILRVDSLLFPSYYFSEHLMFFVLLAAD